MPDYQSAKALREERKALSIRIRQMADGLHADNEARRAKNEPPRDFTAEEQASWEAVNGDYNALTRRIDIAERADSVDAEQKKPVGDPLVGRTPWNTAQRDHPLRASRAQRDLAFSGWMRYQAGFDPSDAEEEAAEAAGVRFRAKDFEFSRPIRSQQQQYWEGAPLPKFDAATVMSGEDGTGGGYLYSETMVMAIERALLYYGGMRKVSEIITTTSGEPMHWPTVDDTGNTGSLVSENASISDATVPAWGAAIWNAYMYTSSFIKVPYSLLQDVAFNLPEIIGSMLGERVGRRLNTDFTNGSGAAMPYGLTQQVTTGVTCASSTAIAPDELFNLVHSIDPAYREMGCGWMFHDNTLLALRLLKDGLGRYLWQEGMSVGEPNRLLGYPYTVNQDMASTIAASKLAILFGMLSKYKIRDVGGMRLRRLEERYADTDQVAFVLLSRHDGRLLDAGKHPVKSLVLHS